MRWTFTILMALGAIATICVMSLCSFFEPYWHPENYLASIERTAAPTIAAIDAYTAKVGHPPKALGDLLPEYDAARAGTGYPRQEEFFYRYYHDVVSTSPPDGWVLVLWTDWIDLDSDAITFSSTSRRWVCTTGQ